VRAHAHINRHATIYAHASETAPRSIAALLATSAPPGAYPVAPPPLLSSAAPACRCRLARSARARASPPWPCWWPRPPARSCAGTSASGRAPQGCFNSGGGGGHPAPRPWPRDSTGFRPTSCWICMGSNGMYLSLAPLTDRESSPQVRPLRRRPAAHPAPPRGRYAGLPHGGAAGERRARGRHRGDRGGGPGLPSSLPPTTASLQSASAREPAPALPRLSA
jgi:hypothetical protein